MDVLNVASSRGCRKAQKNSKKNTNNLTTKLQVLKGRRIPRKNGKEGRKKHSKKVAIKER